MPAASIAIAGQWAYIDVGCTASCGVNAVPPAGNETDKVTFCDRTWSRSVTDDETPSDGIDNTSTYLQTKSSHVARLCTGDS